jgi:hypothetical protein
MKRSEALKGLSHQHHQGLFATLQLKRERRETAAEARKVFLDFFQREGARHFRAEEELLLPAFARHSEFDRPENTLEATGLNSARNRYIALKTAFLRLGRNPLECRTVLWSRR